MDTGRLRVRLYALSALGFLALALLACGANATPTATLVPVPTAAANPEAGTAEIRVLYHHVLYTHCGIRYADFNGLRWLADPVLTSNEGLSPPPGWDNPNYRGTIELVTKDRAKYIAGPGPGHGHPYLARGPGVAVGNLYAQPLVPGGEDLDCLGVSETRPEGVQTAALEPGDVFHSFFL